MNAERGVLVVGSDPPSVHNAHNTAGGTSRRRAGVLYTNIFHGCVETDDKMLDISPMENNAPFMSVWGIA